MRIAYIGHTRFPTEKAHGRQIAEVCSAMAVLGHEVTLLIPSVRTPITETPFSYYGVPENFRVERLQSFDAIHHPLVPQPLAFTLYMWSYRRALGRRLAKTNFDLLYCRSHAVLPALISTGLPVIGELHTLPSFFRRRFVRLCIMASRVVCLTTPMRDTLLSWGVDPVRLVVEGDAVRESCLRESSSVAVLRVRFRGKPVVGYIGSLVARNSLEKGVGELIRAFAILKSRGIFFRGMIIGGPSSWRKQYEEEAKRLGLTPEDIVFTDHVKADVVPSLMAKCDLLVYPAPASQHPYFLRDTSPLKLFEYMAAGKPIVAADLPPVRDILDESVAALCVPGDSADLARAISNVLKDPDGAAARAHAARKRVEGHTWGERMERVLDSM